MVDTSQPLHLSPGPSRFRKTKPSAQLAELEKLYFEDTGYDQNSDFIAYCRIGERSSHSWFVLKYLLGVKNVRNYDGSWTEWGNLVGAPIATGSEPGLAA